VNADVSLLVAGGGPAGVTAALQARELGAQVTLLEADQIGGTSLNRGPAPVRTLARAARLARDWSSWSSFGLRGPAPVPDLPAVLANSERVARYAHDKKDMAGHLRRYGIDLIEDLGPVRTLWPPATGAPGSADRVILAVGGHAARLPIQKICRTIGIGRFPRPGATSDPKNEPTPLPRSDHRWKRT